MKKGLIFFIAILIMAGSIAYGKEPAEETKAFEDKERSIVQFTIAVKLDSDKIKSLDIFKKLESGTRTALLDSNYCTFIGSGFIISKDGYLVTNHHVSKYMSKDETKKRLKMNLLIDVAKNLIPGILTEDEIRRVFKEFNSYLKDAKFKNVVLTNDGKQYEVEIVKENQFDDLSLVKLVGEGEFVPLRINRQDKISAGEKVYAMGYPGILEFLFDDPKVTFTSGVVSAVRDDKWGIQHTASINPGNSGGPLLDENNEVVGVNVGMVENAEGLYFSVPANKLVEWLKEEGYEKIIE